MKIVLQRLLCGANVLYLIWYQSTIHIVWKWAFSSRQTRSSLYKTSINLWDRRNVICVANRVQRPLSRGNGSFVNASRTELLPLDWSPTTTSCGRSTYSPTWHAKSRSIFSRRSGLARPKCEPVPCMIAGLITRPLVYHSRKSLYVELKRFRGRRKISISELRCGGTDSETGIRDFRSWTNLWVV